MNIWLSCEITLPREMGIVIIMRILCGPIENGRGFHGIDNCCIGISILLIVTNIELRFETFALRKKCCETRSN